MSSVENIRKQLKENFLIRLLILSVTKNLERKTAISSHSSFTRECLFPLQEIRYKNQLTFLWLPTGDNWKKVLLEKLIEPNRKISEYFSSKICSKNDTGKTLKKMLSEMVKKIVKIQFINVWCVQSVYVIFWYLFLYRDVLCVVTWFLHFLNMSFF